MRRNGDNRTSFDRPAGALTDPQERKTLMKRRWRTCRAIVSIVAIYSKSEKTDRPVLKADVEAREASKQESEVEAEPRQ